MKKLIARSYIRQKGERKMLHGNQINESRDQSFLQGQNTKQQCLESC